MDLPKRKNTRLLEYDYSMAGAYFITICTHEHKCIFGEIKNVGAIHESPAITYTFIGNTVRKIIEHLPMRFPVRIDKYVIMPNHIHMIVTICSDMDERAIRESPLHNKRSVISKMVGYMKMNVSKIVHQLQPNLNIWQRSYHDHVIRGAEDYKNIWEYMDNNPAKWNLDKYWRDNI